MMALPWLQILDAVIGVTDLARSRKIRKMSQEAADPQQQLEASRAGAALGGLETRLAGVVVAALKEAFERDTHRLELEREQIEAERQRAERALRLELRRQASDREIGRLRLLAGVSVACWIGTLFFSARLIGGPAGARVALGAGWLFLLAAFASSFVAQSRVADAASRTDDVVVDSGVAGSFALWLIVAGLALVGIAVVGG
ncbi:MAG TPA: hypothetical protein VGX46_00385 [Vicinamibacterales bacterium]|jgi:phosphosulfolactate phosphohydrolase-like enzyme|nr:hypothetical protein [Vicinamibacterales bacterium]